MDHIRSDAARFSAEIKARIGACYATALDRIKNRNIGRFKWVDGPLLEISDQYPGIWLEHVYDSVMLARLEPQYLPVAENAIALFIDRQTESGQLPFAVINGYKNPSLTEGEISRFAQVQECVSFFSLALSVYEMNKDRDFLKKIYSAGLKWKEWLTKYRMTTGRGLVEMFVGFDTGHDDSGRLEGMTYKRRYVKDGVAQSAEICPPDAGAAPILAVDMNSNFYGNLMALAKMAALLGKSGEARDLESDAMRVKELIFDYCYDEADAFFYDVDKSGSKRRYKSSTIFHLFLEGVLDKDADRALIDRIYNEHLKNPKEFWTEYPFPSMAMNDPAAQRHAEHNSWGYYTQGLIVLRCSLWMDAYGYGDDYDHILSRWVQAWTEHYDRVKFAQELDPVTGEPTNCSEWYSSCMLAYVYAVRRLGLI